MTYEEIINKIENVHRFGNATGRQVTEEFMEALGHPEHGMKIIHIAGTNGKGSTAAFLSQILEDAAFNVGTFTSPHLIDFRERIVVNGEMISRADVERIGNEVLKCELKLQPTMFDYCLAIAMMYFKERNVDYIVLETGLGGRCDSTRGLDETPVCSIITSIGFDHTAYLGNTYESIAYEKAGILRPGTYAVIGSMDERADRVITDTCRELNLEFFDCNLNADESEEDKYTAYSTILDGVRLGLNGLHQRNNAMCAIAAAEYLLGTSDKGINDCIISGLSHAIWPGRMQQLSEKPFFMVDGAHNPQGVEALKQSLEAMYPGEKFIFLLGVLSDKDYMTMITDMLPLAEEFITVTVDSSRALAGNELANMIETYGVKATYCNDLSVALDMTSKKAEEKKKKAIGFGSLYFIGSLIEKINMI